jgi:hypothetical protein
MKGEFMKPVCLGVALVCFVVAFLAEAMNDPSVSITYGEFELSSSNYDFLGLRTLGWIALGLIFSTASALAPYLPRRNKQ